MFAGKAREENQCLVIIDDEKHSQRTQTPGALWVTGGAGPSAVLPLLADARHLLRRVALHLDPRRPQRDPRDFHHGLLGIGKTLAIAI